MPHTTHRRTTTEHPQQERPWRNAAFTLIELLVVIGIIATLIAILIPVLGKVRQAGYGAATRAQLSKLATAMTAYHGDFRAWPGPLTNQQVGAQYYNNNGPYIT